MTPSMVLNDSEVTASSDNGVLVQVFASFRGQNYLATFYEIYHEYKHDEAEIHLFITKTHVFIRSNCLKS